MLVDTDFPSRRPHLHRRHGAGRRARVVAGDTEAWSRSATRCRCSAPSSTCDKEVESARIYAAARGLYELQLNGEPVGDQELAPGWTDYNTRIQYQTYDVTDQLGAGDNAFGAEIADGWYAGRVAMFGRLDLRHATPR